MKTWVGNTAQGVTPDMAFQALRRRATPFQGGVFVSDGDVTDIPGLGRVRHIVDADRRTIVNTTMPEHLLHPGNVFRSIVREGDDLFVVTHGYGTGVWPKANEVAARRLWPKVDSGIRDELNPPLPLGYPMDEMNAIPGGTSPTQPDVHGSFSGNGASPLQSANLMPYDLFGRAKPMTDAAARQSVAGGLLGILQEAIQRDTSRSNEDVDPNPQGVLPQATASQPTQPVRRLVRMGTSYRN